MTTQLVVKLRAPDPPQEFVVDVNADDWRIEAQAGFNGHHVEALNQALVAVRQEFNRARFFRSFPGFVERLRDDQGSDRELALYFRIALPGRIPRSLLQRIADRLVGVGPIVQAVTLAPATRPADCDQGYVRSSDDGGVNAVFAWDPELPGGRGGNVSVCLLDGGHDEAHPDLPSITYLLEPAYEDKDHGTNCIGIVLALPSAPVAGIAYEANGLVSSTTHGVTAEELILNAMDAALAPGALAAGDVLWVPHETIEGEPLETIADIRQSFIDAADQGIVVVEPAGNDNHDVDELSPTTLAGESVPNVDSRAIMVGAGQWAGPPTSPNEHARERVENTNYGHRVDCQGWGENVCTTRWIFGADPGWYKSDFGHTSAAASIIAGVAAVVQSVQQAAGREPIPPLDLREKLQNNSLGQPQPLADAGLFPIGPLPDIQRLLRDCDLLPDCFLRDHLGDDGSEPSTDSIWHSPDIVPRSAQLANPDADLGGDENWGEDKAETLERDRQGFVYLRVKNRGPFDDTPGIDLYWAYPGTFLSPNEWIGHHIGHVDPTVPGTVSGGNRIVTAAMPWTPPSDTDHPCLIAVLNSKFDEAPALVPQSIDADYIAFVQTYNNIAHRNVITAEATEDTVFWRFNARVPPFWMGSSWMEILPELPEGSRLFVGLPPGREEAFPVEHDPRRFPSLCEDADEGFGNDPGRVREALRQPTGDRRGLEDEGALPEQWISLGAGEKLRFERLGLEAGEKVPLMVGVRLPAGESGKGHAVAVSQYLDRRLIGRVNLKIGTKTADRPREGTGQKRGPKEDQKRGR